MHYQSLNLLRADLVGKRFVLKDVMAFGEALSANLRCEWTCEVASVEVVRVGHPGRIEEVVDLR